MSPSRLSVLFQKHEHTVVLILFSLLALALVDPLAAQFADHIPGVDGDVWSYLWAMGWARISVLNLGTNPFHSDYIFYPLGGATQLLWGTALPSFASIPLQLAFGLVPAFNLVYLAASILTAYGMYLLTVEIFTTVRRPQTTGAGLPSAVNSPSPAGPGPSFGSPGAPTNRPPSALRLAAILTAIIFTFGALRTGYGIAFTNLYHTEFIPFYVLYLLRATERGGRKNALVAGLLFAFNVYIDFQIAAFLALFTGLWMIWLLARDPKGFWKPLGSLPKTRLFNLVLLGVTAALLSLPMLAFLLQDFSIEGGDYIRVYPLKYSADRSYDLLSYIVPNARSTIYQPIAPRVDGVNASVNTPDDSELSPDRQAFIGVTVFVLVLVGLWRSRRGMGFWLLSAGVFALLALGPVLHVAGAATGIPLPFALLNNVPIVNHIRIPMRYGILFFFSLAILAGAGARVLLERRRWLLIPLGALVVVEAGIFPYPTLAYTVPPIYEKIAREAGDFTILEIPSFNWRFAAKNETYQITHQKRILRAYTNRIAPDVADYFSLRATPFVVKTMRVLEGAEPGEAVEDRVSQDRAVLMDTLRFFNLRYAVVHRDQLEPKEFTRIDSYLRSVLQAAVVDPDGTSHDDTVVAYTFPAPLPPPSTLAVNLADDASLMYLGRGWQTEPLADLDDERGRFWKGSTSEIYFNSSYTNRITLRLNSAGSPQYLEIPGLERYDLASTWTDYTVPLLPYPTPFAVGNLLTLTFSHGSNRAAASSFTLK